MKPATDEKKDKLNTNGVDTMKYVERKLFDKGFGRLERHPADGLSLKHNPKKGHGGKYTWEGSQKVEEAPPTIDEKDPNYVEEEGTAEVSELVVGEVEVAKTAEEGVARIEVDPHLKVNILTDG